MAYAQKGKPNLIGTFKAPACVTVSLTLHWPEQVMDAKEGNILYYWEVLQSPIVKDMGVKY